MALTPLQEKIIVDELTQHFMKLQNEANSPAPTEAATLSPESDNTQTLSDELLIPQELTTAELSNKSADETTEESKTDSATKEELADEPFDETEPLDISIAEAIDSEESTDTTLKEKEAPTIKEKANQEDTVVADNQTPSFEAVTLAPIDYADVPLVQEEKQPSVEQQSLAEETPSLSSSSVAQTISQSAEPIATALSNEQIKKANQLAQKQKNQAAIDANMAQKKSNMLVQGADWVQKNIFERVANWMPIDFLKSAIKMIGNTLTGLFKTIGHLFDGNFSSACQSGLSWFKDAAVIGGSIAGAIFLRKQIKKLTNDSSSTSTSLSAASTATVATTIASSLSSLSSDSANQTTNTLKSLASQTPVANADSTLSAQTLLQNNQNTNG